MFLKIIFLISQAKHYMVGTQIGKNHLNEHPHFIWWVKKTTKICNFIGVRVNSNYLYFVYNLNACTKSEKNYISIAVHIFLHLLTYLVFSAHSIVIKDDSVIYYRACVIKPQP